MVNLNSKLGKEKIVGFLESIDDIDNADVSLIEVTSSNFRDNKIEFSFIFMRRNSFRIRVQATPSGELGVYLQEFSGYLEKETMKFLIDKISVWSDWMQHVNKE